MVDQFNTDVWRCLNSMMKLFKKESVQGKYMKNMRMSMVNWSF